jgi:hypothetical protein
MTENKGLNTSELLGIDLDLLNDSDDIDVLNVIEEIIQKIQELRFTQGQDEEYGYEMKYKYVLVNEFTTLIRNTDFTQFLTVY